MKKKSTKSLKIQMLGLSLLALVAWGCSAEAPSSTQTKSPNISAPQTELIQSESSSRNQVEEADLYRVRGQLLFYLHRYKGLLIYDLKDPRRPKELASVPVYGYPVEMFVGSNWAYLMINKPLQVIQQGSGLVYTHSNTGSQLISVDISDPTKPILRKRLPIKGELVRGQARKRGDALFLVAYEPGVAKGHTWNIADPSLGNRSVAGLTSMLTFDITAPARMKLTERLPLNSLVPAVPMLHYDTQQTVSMQKLAEIKMTSMQPEKYIGTVLTMRGDHILMAERWVARSRFETQRTTQTIRTFARGCSGGTSSVSSRTETVPFDVRLNFTIVTVFDASQPSTGLRPLHRFLLQGDLSDQFKQSIHDGPPHGAVYMGIFRRNTLRSSPERVWNEPQNIVVSVSFGEEGPGPSTRIVSTLPFGKPGETVRASLFDHKRDVLYAITATGEDRQQNPADSVNVNRSSTRREVVRMTDPLYAISIGNPKKPAILSEIDGLSGDINLFRRIDDGNTLLAVGRDTSPSCSGFDKGVGFSRTAVSLVDVKDLNNIRLIQRKCVSVSPDIAITSSQLNWDRGQAHKMIGFYEGSEGSFVTVPVQFDVKLSEAGKTITKSYAAVGMMKWDLAAYDRSKEPQDQKVLRNLGTVMHPEPHILRSTFVAHDGAGLLMVNLSEEYMAITGIRDPDKPDSMASVQLAPHVEAVYQMGEHLVEVLLETPQGAAVDPASLQPHNRSLRVLSMVKGSIHNAPIVATEKLGSVVRFLRWKHLLLTFKESGIKTLVEIFDLSQPASPSMVKRMELPHAFYPAYPVSVGGPKRAEPGQWKSTEHGLLYLFKKFGAKGQVLDLHFLDLRDPKQPKVELLRTYTYGSQGNFLLQPAPDVAIFSSGHKLDGTFEFFSHIWSWNQDKGSWEASKLQEFPGQVWHAFKKEGRWFYLSSLGATNQQLALLTLDASTGHVVLHDTLAWGHFSRDKLHVRGERLYINMGTGIARYSFASGKFEVEGHAAGKTQGLTLSPDGAGAFLANYYQLGLLLMDPNPSNGALKATHFVPNFLWKQTTNRNYDHITTLSQQHLPITHLVQKGTQVWIAAGRFGTLELDLKKPQLLQD